MYAVDFNAGLEWVRVGPRRLVQINRQLELLRYERMAPLIGQHGHSFHPHPFPEDSVFPMLEGERCYDAAFQVASEFGLIYCEGVLVIWDDASGAFMTLAHGWCCTPNGKLIDPVGWRHLGAPLSLDDLAALAQSLGYVVVVGKDTDNNPCRVMVRCN